MWQRIVKMGQMWKNGERECVRGLQQIFGIDMAIYNLENFHMQKFHKPKKIKIVLLGNRAVGKSSIISRYVLDDFPQDLQPTVGVDYMSKTITHEGAEYRLQLWDTAGQQKYRSLVKGYLKGAHACLYVYDCRNMNSYMDLVQWVNLFQSANPDSHASFIAGNKCDLSTREDQQELQRTKTLFKKTERKINQFEQLPCSAKSDENINKIFSKIVQKVVTNLKFDKKRSSTLIGKQPEGYMTVRCCES